MLHYVKVLSAMKIHRYFYPLLLVFALLLTQLGGLTHGISHILAEHQHSQDKSQASAKLCNLCAAYAQVGSALGSSTDLFTATEQTFIFVATHFSSFYAVSITAYSARGPPSST